MDGYTLISFIGKGRIKDGGKDGEYETTIYQFPDGGKKCETSLFFEAILKTEYRRPIKKVILVGTRTSSWDQLVADRDNNEDFFLKIYEECSKKGICDDSKDDSKSELESRLQGWYGIPFEIILTDKINRDNIIDIFTKYGEIPGKLEPKTNILFDITHGFRSMPLLVYQSLQLSVNVQKIFERKVELIYGELNYGVGKISPVHDLSKYWEYYEIGSAIKLFDEKLNGRLLAEKIEKDWESGAKILKRLSDIVECNFSLQIPEALKQLKNVLKDFNENEKQPWHIDVRNKLAEINNRLSVKDDEKYPVAMTVWKYSKLLREKKLITQAVIALQVVTETALTEKIDRSKIGDYDWFRCDDPLSIGLKENGRQQLIRIRGSSEKIKEPLVQLEILRNQIAHGGGKDKGKDKEGNFPHQANIEGILKSIDAVIQDFFTILDQDNYN